MGLVFIHVAVGSVMSCFSDSSSDDGFLFWDGSETREGMVQKSSNTSLELVASFCGNFRSPAPVRFRVSGHRIFKDSTKKRPAACRCCPESNSAEISGIWGQLIFQDSTKTSCCMPVLPRSERA